MTATLISKFKVAYRLTIMGEGSRGSGGKAPCSLNLGTKWTD